MVGIGEPKKGNSRGALVGPQPRGHRFSPISSKRSLGGLAMLRGGMLSCDQEISLGLGEWGEGSNTCHFWSPDLERG